MKNFNNFFVLLTSILLVSKASAIVVPCSETPDQCAPPAKHDNGTPDNPFDDIPFDPGCAFSLQGCTRTDSAPTRLNLDIAGTFDGAVSGCDACDTDPPGTLTCGPEALEAKFTEHENLSIDAHVVTGKAAVEAAYEAAIPATDGKEVTVTKNCTITVPGHKKDGMFVQGTTLYDQAQGSHRWQCVYAVGTSPSQNCSHSGQSQSSSGGYKSSIVSGTWVTGGGCKTSGTEECEPDEPTSGGTE